MIIKFINLKYIDHLEYDTSRDISFFIGENGSGKSLAIKHLSLLYIVSGINKDITEIKVNTTRFIRTTSLSYDDIVISNENEYFGYEIIDGKYSYEFLFSLNEKNASMILKSIRINSNENDKKTTLLRAKPIKNDKLSSQVSEILIGKLEKKQNAIWDEQIDPTLYNVVQMPNDASVQDLLAYYMEMQHALEGGQLYGFDLTVNIEALIDYIKDECQGLELQIEKDSDTPNECRSVQFFLSDEISKRSRYREILEGSVLRNDKLWGYGFRSIVDTLFTVSYSLFTSVDKKILLRTDLLYPENEELSELVANEIAENLLRGFLFKDVVGGEVLREEMDFWALSKGFMNERYKGVARTREHDIVLSDLYIRHRGSDRDLDDLGGAITESKSARYDWSQSVLSVNDGELGSLMYKFMTTEVVRKEKLESSLQEMLQIDRIECAYVENDKSLIQINIIRSDKRVLLNSLSRGEFHVLSTCIEAAFTQDILYLNEPELHLHPNLQSKLIRAIFSVLPPAKKVIIETHSPYMVRELQLLEVETKVHNENVEHPFMKKAKMSEKCVIYYISKLDPGLNRTITIKENGDLSQEIPEGFSDHLTRLNMLRLQFLD